VGPGLLDFWLGRWDVYDRDGILAGHDVVELVLGGRAVLEHWRNREGREGKSLFWLEADGSWRQVWVTEGGIVKEKALVARNGGADVLFEGEAVLPDGRRLRDRTTLAPLADNHVWQLIEASEDGGESWETTFDAIYAPVD
jgi:hypothetical protein